MSTKRKSGKGRPTPAQRKTRHRSRSLNEQDYFYWFDRHQELLDAMLWLLANPVDESRAGRIEAMQTMTVNALMHLYGTRVPMEAVTQRPDEQLRGALPDLPFEVPDDVSSLDSLTPAAVLTQAHPPLDYRTEDGTANTQSAFPTYLDQYLECSLLCLHARWQETRWAGQLDARVEEAQQRMTFWREAAESWDAVEWASIDLEDYREEQRLRLQRLVRERRNNPGRPRPGTRL
jgi:hypothetical protein